MRAGEGAWVRYYRLSEVCRFSGGSSGGGREAWVVVAGVQHPGAKHGWRGGGLGSTVSTV